MNTYFRFEFVLFNLVEKISLLLLESPGFDLLEGIKLEKVGFPRLLELDLLFLLGLLILLLLHLVKQVVAV